MSNAIEYNHEGGTVELSARSDEASTEIIVKDDGPGISPEHLPHLFQPFYRASRSRESDGHLGLGLFLVESHVKAMGGECRVESALGRGTTFRVRLPGNAARVNGNGGV
jgi:signal transduction histidine kinase